VRLANRVRHIFGGGLKISLESWMTIGKKDWLFQEISSNDYA